jgi:hypothetical protein
VELAFQITSYVFSVLVSLRSLSDNIANDSGHENFQVRYVLLLYPVNVHPHLSMQRMRYFIKADVVLAVFAIDDTESFEHVRNRVCTDTTTDLPAKPTIRPRSGYQTYNSSFRVFLSCSLGARQIFVTA